MEVVSLGEHQFERPQAPIHPTVSLLIKAKSFALV
jgi:hypothetical protein